ncbi:AAA family ATPase [Methylobacterium sp. J-026]|uniref:AAA family ATPase n=1 Tax=Methylobacterium sp. J-026 TaxID=2836624 RepID=UPI001FB87F08|nr:AAA family ATPase [Methylobacterium sp. J-026]MCJ2137414.1 AAA family ATPase [Methylobacterium sp. J-026]
MRLNSVFISQYKNLRDFSLNFEGDHFIDIFVGRNGSGKSNFLEALIEIFDHIYGFKVSSPGPDFDYEVAWDIGGATTTLRWFSRQMSINGVARKQLGKTRMPANVIVYYSGQNNTVAALIRRYRDSYRRSVKKANVAASPRFIGIGPDYKTLLVALMLMLPEASQARRFLCTKLGIEVTGGTTRLKLRRPVVAHKTRQYDPLDNGQLFWGVKGIARTFLDQLMRCITEDFSPASLYDRDSDTYELGIDVAKYRKVFDTLPSDEVFCQFNALRALNMIADISIPVRLAANTEVSSRAFSDGQFQSVYLFAISELFKDRECITLLDEPDAFLHPEWQFDFLHQTLAISNHGARTNHILMSSHSASTIAAKVECRIRQIEFTGVRTEAQEKDKGELIKSLSAGLIIFSEKEAALNIERLLDNTTGPVLFTEGISDVFILRSAWINLFPGQTCPFEIVQAFDCAFLRNLMKRQSLYQGNPGRKFFALFDFDGAYQDWSQLGELIEPDIEKCLTVKHRSFEGYAMLLPVSNGLSVRNQVWNSNTNRTFEGESRLSIELLLKDAPGIEQHFAVDVNDRAGWIKFNGDKLRFASEVVPQIPAQHLVVFKPIFDFVLSRI